MFPSTSAIRIWYISIDFHGKQPWNVWDLEKQKKESALPVQASQALQNRFACIVSTVQNGRYLHVLPSVVPELAIRLVSQNVFVPLAFHQHDPLQSCSCCFLDAANIVLIGLTVHNAR